MSARSPRKIGLVGLGAIGAAIVRLWEEMEVDSFWPLAALCVRPGHEDSARALLHPGTRLVTSVEDMLRLELDLIIEAAGHEFILQHGRRILSCGIDLMILSVGALAVGDTLTTFQAAAAQGACRMIFPSGALAGFDGLRSLARTGSLHAVTYTSTKPPAAWKNTPAEANIDFANLATRVILFRGSARDAARLYPKNANLAAAVAFAGVGLDATRVELVADPHARGNRNAIRAESSIGTLEVTLASSASGQNPKTSATTAYSVIAALSNSVTRYSFW
ncbi:aspartate dehydrogenase [Caballeronia mineralivorans]|uniref:aspartate dehydrogenase n=1 Tax=Caballeronia mineralivorans TaxID=2010198 RepID=UPI0023EFD727|nr:aspartate dehydrogenase [Caballeronia mineralivorans]MDB5782049.1 Aspartate dehydrogenase [Caballeronia mineralivorans]